MRELCHTVRLNAPIDDNLHRVATDLLSHTQAALSQVSTEHDRLQARIEELTRENHTLRAENQKLRNLRMTPAAAPSRKAAPGVEAAADGFQFVKSIQIHEAPVHSVAMDKNNRIATASWDATVKLYDLQNEQVVQKLGDVDGGCKGSMGGLYAVAFAKTAPDVLGCSSCDHSVYIWNHVDGNLLTKLSAHTDEVNGIDFHSSQQVMCSASDDCKVIVWDFKEGMVLRTLDKHTKSVYGCKFLGSDFEYFVASCCFDRMSRVWDMRDKQVVKKLEMHNDDVIGIDYAFQKKLLATGSDDGKIGIWDARTWTLQQTINTRTIQNENEVKRVSFSPDGSLLAAACSSGCVLVYDMNTHAPKPVATLGGHTDCVFDVTWGTCPVTGAKQLVSASHDHTVRYWKESS